MAVADKVIELISKQLNRPAEEITLETIIDYAFHNLKALDLKVSEISIEDVVKTILQEQEGNNNV